MPNPLALSFGLKFEDAIAAAQARGVLLPGEYYGQRSSSARRAATTVSGVTMLDQVQAVIDSLNDALAQGRAFGEWKKDAEARDWKLPPGRLETVFRTNVQTAYAAGHWKSFEEGRLRRPYLMWSAINDSRVRPTHLAMDGYIAHVDDPIWRVWHPPAGYNCRCSQISLNETQAKARGLGRQHVPAVTPDKGFAGGTPGDIEGGAAKASVQRASIADPVLAQGLAERAAQQRDAPVAQGRAVSKALGMPARHGEEVSAAMSVIDRLHGDGELPSIPVQITTHTRAYGFFQRDSALNPKRIGVSGNGDHQRLTFAHEVGHFLDGYGWGEAGSWSSTKESAAAAWRDAVRSSPSIEALRLLPKKKYVRYLLTTHETWARAYAQWVATRSGDQVMRQELAALRAKAGAQGLSQWGDAEFEPIGKAIDNLFELLGWRKP